jgi:hypothetical protein
MVLVVQNVLKGPVGSVSNLATTPRVIATRPVSVKGHI